MTAQQDLRNHLRREHDHDPERTASFAEMSTWHVEAHDRRGSVYHTRHRGDEAYASPPCVADAGGGDVLELVANLAESLHLHHVDQPPSWRDCEHAACRQAQAVGQ